MYYDSCYTLNPAVRMIMFCVV